MSTITPPRTAAPALAILVIVVSIVGAGFAVLQLIVPPAVDVTTWSYPLAPTPFLIGQLVVAVHHFVLAAGLFVAWRIGLAGTSRLARVGAISAPVLMVLFGVVEIVSGAAGGEATTSEIAGILGGVYGVFTILLAVASIVFGVAIIRASRWTGFTRLTVLVTGIYLIVPLIPAQFDVTARAIAVAVWCLLYLGLAAGLRRGPAN